MAVVGLDGCKSGWFAVRLEDEGGWDIGVFRDITGLWREWNDADSVFIDIPIGLPHGDRPIRRCDTEARKLLGRPRASSVFPPPGRAALLQTPYTVASEINLAEVSAKLNQQTWNILPKIRQVDTFLRNEASGRQKVREIHPEVCFWAFNDGGAIALNKKTLEGRQTRLDILRTLDDRTDAIRERAMSSYLRKEVAEDDIYDALIAAITATHHPNDLVSIPSTPEYDAYGLRMEMVHMRV